MRKKKEQDDGNAVLLKHADDSYELGIIKALLDDNNISYYTKEAGIDQYMRLYTGRALNGTDVMVPEQLRDKAAKLLVAIGMSSEKPE